MVQWLRLHASNAGGTGLIPVQEIKLLQSIEENNMCKGKTARKSIACTRLRRNLVDTIIFILIIDTMIIVALMVKLFETQPT